MSRRFAILMAAILIAAACGGSASEVVGDAGTNTTDPDINETTDSSGEAADTTTSDQDVVEDIDFGFDVDALFETLTASYADGADLWPGFIPTDFPTILVSNNERGEPVGVIALNYPAPESIGDARELDLADSIGSVHTITNLNDGALAAVSEVSSMGFDVDVEAVVTFVVLIDPPGTGDLFDPENPSEFSATLLHEMFHIYQFSDFAEGEGDQDIAGYAYTAENMALALLEDRALVAALEADNPEDQETAARHLGAIRLVRLDLDPRVVLDEDQEIFEGTARDYESQIAGIDPSFTFRSNNYVENLRTDAGAIFGPVKLHFGFDRFYGSGAAQLELLRRLGVDGVEERVQAGESPMDVVIAELGLTLEEAPALLEEARGIYDPTEELDVQAAELATRSADELDPLSEESLAALDEQGSLEGQLRATFGDEAYECLEEAGADFEAVEPPPDSILSGCGVDLSLLGAGPGSDGETLDDETIQCLSDAGYNTTSSEPPSADVLAECGLD